MWDNDTMIQPGEKEDQTDVSSALKKFYGHYSSFSKNPNFWFFELYKDFLYKKPRKVVRGVVENQNLEFSQ